MNTHRTLMTLLTTGALLSSGTALGALVELRVDMSDADAFTDRDGEATDSTTSLAFEMTCTF